MIKILGLGTRFFIDKYNVFDFLVAIGSTVGLILEKNLGKSIIISNTMRSFRIGRIFKLFRQHKSLSGIFQAFIITLPALLNVGGLLLLFIFIYSVITMNFLAPLKFTDAMSENMNFMSVTNSMVTLFVMQTGVNFFPMYESAASRFFILY